MTTGKSGGGRKGTRVTSEGRKHLLEGCKRSEKSLERKEYKNGVVCKLRNFLCVRKHRKIRVEGEVDGWHPVFPPSSRIREYAALRRAKVPFE